MWRRLTRLHLLALVDKVAILRSVRGLVHVLLDFRSGSELKTPGERQVARGSYLVAADGQAVPVR
jgi:hypothetical protein